MVWCRTGGCNVVIGVDRLGRSAMRTEDAQGTPNHSRIPPNILGIGVGVELLVVKNLNPSLWLSLAPALHTCECGSRRRCADGRGALRKPDSISPLHDRKSYKKRVSK